MGLDLRTIVLVAPVIIFSLTVHEFSHAWMANRFGDPTAKNMGRLSLNPLAHLDLFGLVMLFVSNFRFGWAKPVPVNPYNLRNQRHDDFWISAAGPLSNLSLALIAGMIFRAMNRTEMLGQVSGLDWMIFYGITINVSLAVFNLLPIFPLDGSHILRNILPEEYGPTIDRIEQFSPVILMVLIFSGFLFRFSILWVILGPIVRAIVLLFSGVQI
jgi:Zn-dependent protease